VKLCVLSTSYPRDSEDVSGFFVRDAVDHLRAAGVEVEVVSPASFHHYGIAYGDGVPANLRRRPWKALLLPLFLLSFVRAARRVARGADLVHAHWLPSGLVAMLAGRPFVVQLWGSDAELARRVPWAFRLVLRRARAVIAPSSALAEAAKALGAPAVELIPSGIEVPDHVPEPEQPPHVLYVGRLAEEKGIAELAEAARGLPLVVVGDGPLRRLLPQATGFVPHDRIDPYYERASVVVCPSRREGFGVACAEAMAHGRPVVASAVGGLVDHVEDGVTGVLVPPRDPSALRAALVRLLGDADLRERLGTAARERARERYDWAAVTRRLVGLYEEVGAIRPGAR
jgi:glycosyltransferase involved in cell wall biosynthesis